jgi:hypothetical protein
MGPIGLQAPLPKDTYCHLTLAVTHRTDQVPHVLGLQSNQIGINEQDLFLPTCQHTGLHRRALSPVLGQRDQSHPLVTGQEGSDCRWRLRA